MKRVIIVTVGLALSACGGLSETGQGAKTPEEILEEQLQLAEDDEKNAKDDKYADVEHETVAFDKRQTKMELMRATRSAESCTGVVDGKDEPRGEFNVQVRFEPDGSVHSVSLPSPLDGSKTGDCVKKGYKHVKVPPFDGEAVDVNVEIELTDPEQEEE